MKTVIFDADNLCVRCLFSKDVVQEDNSVDGDFGKYRVFNSIYSIFFEVKDIDEIVLAGDDRHSGRKIYYPQYKSHRADIRDDSHIDGNEFYEVMDEYRKEIEEYFPFKSLKIKNCEADDIIGVLCLNLDRRFHIISTDNDFLQLSSPNITIYNPIKKEEIAHPDPEMFLRELSLMGQRKDNIPNVKTPLDGPSELRKPGLGKKTCEKIFIQGIDNYLNDILKYKKKYKDNEGNTQVYTGRSDLKERYEFNRNLIDFKRIPNTIRERVLGKYKNYKFPEPGMYPFFDKKGWPEFLENYTWVEDKLLRLF